MYQSDRCMPFGRAQQCISLIAAEICLCLCLCICLCIRMCIRISLIASVWPTRTLAERPSRMPDLALDAVELGP